jgi:glycosyltransferase involved in cell wall biosynthesis
MKISLILPVYNEVKILEESTKKIKRVLNSLNYDYEIIIAEDGSTDGSDKVSARLAVQNSRIKHLHCDQRLGKGASLKNAFANSCGNILIFSDVDLSTDLRFLPIFINSIQQGYDICIGNRNLSNSETDRSLLREISSRAYIFLVKLLFNSKITDYQCGFKAFSRRVLNILLNAKNSGWIWDTEVLLTAEKKRFKIKQVPVEWEERKGSHIKISDTLKMFYDVMKLKIIGY